MVSWQVGHQVCRTHSLTISLEGSSQHCELHSQHRPCTLCYYPECGKHVLGAPGRQIPNPWLPLPRGTRSQSSWAGVRPLHSRGEPPNAGARSRGHRKGALAWPTSARCQQVNLLNPLSPLPFLDLRHWTEMGSRIPSCVNFL